MVKMLSAPTKSKCECCGRPDVDPDASVNGEYLCETCRGYVLAVEEYNCKYSSRLIDN